jgi:hypothetical protein
MWIISFVFMSQNDFACMHMHMLKESNALELIELPSGMMICLFVTVAVNDRTPPHLLPSALHPPTLFTTRELTFGPVYRYQIFFTPDTNVCISTGCGRRALTRPGDHLLELCIDHKRGINGIWGYPVKEQANVFFLVMPVQLVFRCCVFDSDTWPYFFRIKRKSGVKRDPHVSGGFICSTGCFLLSAL